MTPEKESPDFSPREDVKSKRKLSAPRTGTITWMGNDEGTGWLGTDDRQSFFTIAKRSGVPPQVRFEVEGRGRVPGAAGTIGAAKVLARALRPAPARAEPVVV